MLAACTPNAPAQRAELQGGIVAPFEPYPGSVSFCAEHVAGAPPPDGSPPIHIRWTAYHTADPPDRVIAYYRAALGVSAGPPGHTWRDPALDPRRTLSIHARGEAGPWVSARCELPARAGSIILIAHYSSAGP